MPHAYAFASGMVNTLTFLRFIMLVAAADVSRNCDAPRAFWINNLQMPIAALWFNHPWPAFSGKRDTSTIANCSFVSIKNRGDAGVRYSFRLVGLR